MDFWSALLKIVMFLSGAFLFGGLAQKLKQSPILGYIFSGMLIGHLSNSGVLATSMAELGVSLLLFSIGLEFSFGQLKKMGKIAFGGGGLQVAGTLVIVSFIMLFMTELPRALSIGAIVTLSSTTIVLRVLMDTAALDGIHGRASLGILLFQDMAIVPLVLLLEFMTSTGQNTLLGIHILKLIASMTALVLVFYIILYHLVPLILSDRVILANRELTVLFAISVGLGATWAAHSIGISPALGAFVAGMLLDESPFATQIRADIGSVKTILVTIFFASVGLFIKPIWFLTHLHWILLLGSVIFLLKASIVFIVTRLMGLNNRHALATGIALAQVGEFSFVLANTAQEGGLLDPNTMDIVVSVIIVLMLATPFMVAKSMDISGFILRRLIKKDEKIDVAQKKKTPSENQILIVGLGPAGYRVLKTISSLNAKAIVLDLNLQAGIQARNANALFKLGDAAQEEVLLHAGIKQACLAVITTPDTKISIEIIHQMKRLSPDLPIIVRCRHSRHMEDLILAGADSVVDEELSIGDMLSMKIHEYISDKMPGVQIS